METIVFERFKTVDEFKAKMLEVLDGNKTACLIVGGKELFLMPPSSVTELLLK